MAVVKYDPWLEVDSVSKKDKRFKTSERVSYDPWLETEIYQKPKDPMAWKPFEKMTSAEKEEFEFAGKHPTLYGLIKASLETMSDLPVVSYLEYLSPERRQNFKELSLQEQVNELLHHALNTALWAKLTAVKATTPLMKTLKISKKGIFSDVGYVAKLPFAAVGRKLAAKGLPKGFEILPVEDALKKVAILSPKSDFKGFEYGKTLAKSLRKQGFRKEEIELLGDTLESGSGVLSRYDLFGISELTRKGYKFSKAFQKNIPLLPGKTYLRALDKEFTFLHSKPIIEAYFRKTTFENVLRDVYGAKEITKLQPDFSLKLFQERATKLYPKLGKKFNFGDATTEQMANISRSLLEDPLLAGKTVMPGRGIFMLPTLLPTRVVHGIGEKVFGTYSNAYVPIKKGLAKANRNYFNHMLLWAKMLEQAGLYTKIKIDVAGKFIPTKAKFFTPAVAERCNKVITKMSDLTTQASKIKDKVAAKALTAEARALPGKVFLKNDPAILLYNSYRAYSDHLYSDFFKAHFRRTLEKVKVIGTLPKDITKTLEGQSKLLEYEMDNLFSTVSRATPGWKIGSVKRLLGRAQGTILRGEKNLSKEDLIARKKLASLFDYGSSKGFPAYLENYTARLRNNQISLVNVWRNILYSDRMAGFRRPRILASQLDKPVDFTTMLEARTIAQARDLFLYDEIGKVVRYAKRLPPAYQDYIDAHISGVLGLPSTVDHKVAWFLTKTAGAAARAPKRWKGLPVGRTGQWDEWRVLNLAHDVNTLTYLGALGFKPFSAVRNLFQSLLNVPADLGGIKDLGTLVSGVKKAFDPKIRKYLIDIGAITEFAPEIHLRPAALPFGKRMLWGKTLPSLQRMQDVGLWMFKGSDRWNRYVTGGAAIRKWEKSLAKVGGKLHQGNVEPFIKHLNVAGRRDYAQDKIIRALFKGDHKGAMKDFVLDVIADTQYLYGVADAPIILRKYGALSKTGTIFQSWWMNYGTNIEKWIRTGESVGQKTDRMITAMTSTAIAYTLMSAMWGEKFAAGSVGFGPFPSEVNEFLIPPAWKPIYHSLAMIANVQELDLSASHAKRILTSAGIFTPGYLQMKQTWRGTREEGFEGFAKSLLRIKRD